MREKANHKWINNKKNKIIIAAGKLAYWKGFELACPEVFESAKDYSIQTAMGADVFMRLWNFMKDWIRNNQSQNNQNLTDPNTYVPAFKKIIQNSEGIDRNGEATKGIDYWKKGGAAGAQGGPGGGGAGVSGGAQPRHRR